MATMKQETNYCNSSYGEVAAARQANVLASCYLVDNATASLKGLHYCTTSVTGLPSPPTSPPLAAITSDNKLAVTPKSKQRRVQSTSNNNAGPGGLGSPHLRRGGATSRIREECERFFCETMWSLFRDERNSAPRGSGLTGVHQQQERQVQLEQQCYQLGGGGRESNGQLCTPPDEYPFPDSFVAASSGRNPPGRVTAWLELWDYVGGAGFRGFLAEDDEGEKSAFIFFDPGVMGRDLKSALVAAIELADGPLECSHLVVAIDRSIPERDTRSLMKGLQWAGFSLASLDRWAGGSLDVTSSRWLFMDYEV
ncbi:ornithine decarboxylase antizyme [Pyricularia oryzae]|uniref:Ornithine decarboxylase antizyme n=3 Tax=Pyricularia oryzae TaxID=318829 RepID=A0A4V1C7E4_PYROR|nr:ornithine decarboxylase antizyme [Pyricularia oryzae Y34]KAI7914881.1 ornithine decarboxylase antizyme [Pyricularia oryzae]KAI7917496.1 ornithine decarboxylase antizyme [Pyricularia oryzae]QBZ63098.1 hypothetical protein PoMZ_11992 [Pyricularia oryzae]